MSDEPIHYDSIHELAVALARETAPSLRDQPDRGEVMSLVDKLGQCVPSRQDESPLSERIEAIYPVIHRAFDEFIDTEQLDDHADMQKVKIGWSRKKLVLGVFDNNHWGRFDTGVKICLLSGSGTYYSIFRFRPEWRRNDPDYQNSQVTKRVKGVLAPDDECIDICSPYFKIDCCSPPEFVEALRSGDSEPKLRKVILQHLFSIPNILGNYLDKKAKGVL